MASRIVVACSFAHASRPDAIVSQKAKDWYFDISTISAAVDCTSSRLRSSACTSEAKKSE